MNKIIPVVCVMLILISVFLLYIIQPSFFLPTLCPKNAQYVIEQLNLSSIRSCTENELIINQKKVYEIKLIFGEGTGCFTGCVYNHFWGAVSERKIYEFEQPYPLPLGFKIMHYVCGSIPEIIKYKDEYKISYKFQGTPGGRLIVVENGNNGFYNEPYKLPIYDVSQLDKTNYTIDSNCTGLGCPTFNSLFEARAKTLLENMGINILTARPRGGMYDHYNIDSTELRCVNKEIIAFVSFYDYDLICNHHFRINAATETEEYLGCETNNTELLNIIENY